MPQASGYLSDENDLQASDDTPRLDNSKPETWPLLLPSAIPKDDRSPCYKGIIETERVLRLAQLQDGLGDLRRFRRELRNLRLYFKTNTAGEGQKTQTKSRTIETGVNRRIRRAVCRYRVAYRALSELDPAGDWAKEYRELRDEDNRGPLKEIEERGTGDGRYAPSWIWLSPSAPALPGEGSVVEQREIDETARHEWTTCRARADRWMEEEELLQEEMRRVIIYLEWKSRTWSEKVGVRASSCTPDIQHGIDAYARKQADIHHGVAVSFANQWLPYLKAHSFNTKWATGLPWASKILSREVKLPKKFQVIPKDDLPKPPTTDPLPSIKELEAGRKDPGTRETRGEDGGSKEDRHEDGGSKEDQREDGGSKEDRREDGGSKEDQREDSGSKEDRREERSNHKHMSCGEEEQGSDDEGQRSDSESEGCDDEQGGNPDDDDDDDYDDDDSDEGGDFDDDAGANDDLGFEYDDEYMT